MFSMELQVWSTYLVWSYVFSMELHDYYGAMCLVRSYVFSMELCV